jgi:hypothetical protein
VKTILLVLVLCLPAVGQVEKEQPVLQITVDGWGVVWPQGKHNYLTVWPDGTVKYLQKAKRGLIAQVTDGISKTKLDELQVALREVSKPNAGQPAASHPIDYRMTVHIEVAQGSTLEIPHYDFDRPDAVSPAVYSLLCLADTIRDEPYRLTKPAACSGGSR